MARVVSVQENSRAKKNKAAVSDQRQRHAVQAEGETDAERLDPRHALQELVADARLESEPEADHQQRDARSGEADGGTLADSAVFARPAQDVDEGIDDGKNQIGQQLSNLRA